MKRRIVWIVLGCALMAVLAGCTEINKPITPESKGFWNEYIVYPLSWLIKHVAGLLGGSFGLSIIVVTVLIRLLILPLMIQQTRNAKAMQALQPEMEALRKNTARKTPKPSKNSSKR